MRPKENINTLLDRITDHARHMPLKDLKNVDDDKLFRAMSALRDLEKLTTELAFTGKVRKLRKSDHHPYTGPVPEVGPGL